MEHTEVQQLNNKRAMQLLLAVAGLVALVILTVLLTMPALSPEPSPRQLAENMLEYAPITDVEIARQLVVRPGAELHGYRYRVRPSIKSLELYVEAYQDGRYIDTVGWCGGNLHGSTAGEINFSFGLRNNQKSVDWCVSANPGTYYTLRADLPEGFIPNGWAGGALYQPKNQEPPISLPLEADRPKILAAFTAFNTGGIRHMDPALLESDEAYRASFPYLLLLKCVVSESESPERNEVRLGLVEGGVTKYERDVSGLPEARLALQAVEMNARISAAWPARDISTLTQAIRIMRGQQNPIDGEAQSYDTYYAFTLEDGTPVLQWAEAGQFSIMEKSLYEALLEAALSFHTNLQ